MRPKFVSIPKPCSEDWNKMTATEQGAFCAKCTKEVLDCSSLKSTEIKHELSQKKDPCIRIFGHQLDELNFLEWFETLSLRKQLKYLFLFSFLLVFRLDATAQEDDTTLIQPQFVQIDPKDEPTQEESYKELTLQEDYLIDFATIKPTLPDKSYKVTCTETMGFTAWLGDITFEDPPTVESTQFIPTILNQPQEVLAEIKQSNLLLINDLKLTFFIDDDMLIFNTNQLSASSIRLKIKRKDSDDWIYSDIIHLKSGQREIHFPLHEFDNGVYIIVVEQNCISKGIQLAYW